MLRTRIALLAGSFLFLSASAVTVNAQVPTSESIGILPVRNPPPPDSTLYTSFYFQSYTYANWLVCGSTKLTEGCYGIGSLGPFGHVGSLIQGNESIQGNTVARKIYVVDSADGEVGTGVKLYVYQKIDVVTQSSDDVTVRLVNTLSLPLQGGSNVKTYMAANDDFLFIGTSASQIAYEVQKKNLAISLEINRPSPDRPMALFSITRDKYGFVSVNFVDAGGSYSNFQFAPDGRPEGDGGLGEYLLNDTVGFSTTDIASSSSSSVPASRMMIHLKKSPAQTSQGH
jgi:hypothetical protein